MPFYSVDGTADWFYGQPPCFPGFESVANWQNYSEQVLGCAGERTVTAEGPHAFPEQQGAANVTCYEYSGGCPAITAPPGASPGQSGSKANVMCEVQDMTHDASSLGVLLPAAFAAFFGK